MLGGFAPWVEGIFVDGDEELIPFLQARTAVGDDVAMVALDEHDERMRTRRQIAEGHARGEIFLFEHGLDEGKIWCVAFFQRAKHEHVSLLEHGAALWQHFLFAARKAHKERARRQGDVHDALAAPVMIRLDAELDKIDRRFVDIVGEGFENVPAFVDHGELLRNERQERALHGDGKEHDDKDDVEKIVFHIHRRDHGHDGEHDGRGTAQPGEGYEHSARQASAEWCHEQKGRQRTRDKREKNGDGQRWCEHIEHVRRE